MKRYTIYYKFLEDFFPMINCNDLKDVAFNLSGDRDDVSFKVFDNKDDDWLKPELVFLACVFNKNYKTSVQKGVK
jgi:hypothetical protein